MELETKQIIANKVMGFQAKIADVTKRRRNFSKEATAILQEYYENHLAHPYPTEEEKAVLAEKCHISVQQVSNWFGNRRIRTKKSQFSQDLKSGKFIPELLHLLKNSLSCCRNENQRDHIVEALVMLRKQIHICDTTSKRS
ncbi:homeobox domain protein [Ancylostoma caninum]|uniref:Homeobox domain protein n=1 Tax=Ancylostoma caninum TaxID=29170 RepID=A0A368GVN4_ANCCA|nr:homeobox domain protein [Ancylostoma caninum]